MGRHAQAARRTSGGVGAAGLNAPPAPVMALVGRDAWTYAAGVPDPGGVFLLVRGVSDTGPWMSTASDNWSNAKNWGEVPGYEAFWLSSQEKGNGTVYKGWSDYAVALPPRV